MLKANLKIFKNFHLLFKIIEYNLKYFLKEKFNNNLFFIYKTNQ